MKLIIMIKPITILMVISGCAYFNTFYNAKQLYDEANKLRLEKDGEVIPITAVDKYGKVIQKCKIVLNDFPESRFRIDAVLLMSKSRYYRKNYDLALLDLGQVIKEGKSDQIEEALYWKALCKWKKGNIQTGMEELNILLETTKEENIKAKCHLSLAEIANELNSQEGLVHLREAAKLTQNRGEKGMIYGRLAEMAFRKKDYDLAEEGYLNVIAHSLSKENIEHAHLQILKIFRVQNRYLSASRKIKGMLIDSKFERIAGSLELELVQLYKAQGETSEIETRLESIVDEYQRTSVSAEAYYQLGQIYTSEKWDLAKAKGYFDAVQKEYSKSFLVPLAKSKSNAIEVFQDAEKELKTHQTINVSEDLQNINNNDSTFLNVSLVSPKRSIPELYYQLADLEAFSFQRYDKSIDYLKKIISEYSDSPFKPKAMFVLAFVYETIDDTISAKNTRQDILTYFPSSEYASYFDKNIMVEEKIQVELFRNAEKEIPLNINKAIESFKEALYIDTNNDLAISAAYSIGYYYDQEAVIDSALYYYNWIKENYPNSEQTEQISERIQTLNNVLSFINADTLNIDPKEEN